MKKRFLPVLLCAVLLVTILPVTARADFGPKSSVEISFVGMGDARCYGTLLSNTASVGRESVWNGTEEDIRAPYGRDIWEAFVNYEDPDGYYFLQVEWRVDKDKKITMNGASPAYFKILLYFPESQTFAVSGVCKSYAFNSYYTVKMAGVDVGAADSVITLEAHRSYHFMRELWHLVVRVLITILLELGVALLFGYGEKEQIRLIARVNVLTQILLNVLLNVINYHAGLLAFVLFYLILECIVLLVESIVYSIWIPKISQKRCTGLVAVFYALAANAVSFIAGVIIGVFQSAAA